MTMTINRIRRRSPLHVCLVGLMLMGPVYAQQVESPPAPKDAFRPTAYLPKGAVDYRLVLPPPPAEGSIQDQIDHDSVILLQTEVDTDRWQGATDDASYVFARFETAFAHSINRTSTPFTVYILDRVLRDVAAPAFEAKTAFQRPRPFQRYQLSRLCGDGTAPAPETHPTQGSSYPSGHSAYGWSMALVLAQIAPSQAPAVLQRAADYAQSRLICGVHFPSDTEAGRALAVAVVERLKSVKAFRHDLSCARAEIAKSKTRTACRLPKNFVSH